MSLRYNQLSDEIEKKIKSDRKSGYVNPYRFDDINAVRRDMSRDRATVLRPAFCRDTEKILSFPY